MTSTHTMTSTHRTLGGARIGLRSAALFLLMTSVACSSEPEQQQASPPVGNVAAASSTAPSLLTTSLLKNGDFESTDLGYKPWVLYVHATPDSYIATQGPEFARSGVLGIEVKQAIDEAYGALAQNVVTELAEAGRYRLEAHVRSIGVVQHVALNVDITGGGRPAQHFERKLEASELSASWLSKTLDIEILAGRADLEVLIVLYGPGEIYIDDVSLTPLP